MRITDLTAKAEIKEKIELVYYLDKESNKIEKTMTNVFSNLKIKEIICIDKSVLYSCGIYDIIYIKYEDNDNYMFLGHWNDGIL